MTYPIDELEQWQIGYIACMFDTEGSFSLIPRDRKNRSTRIQMNIKAQMVCELTLRTLHQITALGYITSAGTTSTGKQYWGWVISNPTEGSILLRHILPKMITKRKQAELMLEYCQRRIAGILISLRDDKIVEEICYLNGRKQEV